MGGDEGEGRREEEGREGGRKRGDKEGGRGEIRREGADCFYMNE